MSQTNSSSPELLVLVVLGMLRVLGMVVNFIVIIMIFVTVTKVKLGQRT